jgi:hypothetical protein
MMPLRASLPKTADKVVGYALDAPEFKEDVPAVIGLFSRISTGRFTKINPWQI